MLKKKLEEIRDDIVDKFVSDFQRYRAVMDDDELLDVLADSTDYLLDLLERKIMRLGIDAETYIAYFKENVSKEAFNTFLSAEALYGPAHDNILGAYNGTEKVSKDMSEILEKMFISHLRINVEGHTKVYFVSLIEGIYYKYRAERSA